MIKYNLRFLSFFSEFKKKIYEFYYFRSKDEFSARKEKKETYHRNCHGGKFPTIIIIIYNYSSIRQVPLVYITVKNKFPWMENFEEIKDKKRIVIIIIIHTYILKRKLKFICI